MDTKQSVIKILKENEGKYVSGEGLSNLLGVSRTAVWKAVARLKQEGFIIVASTKNGYMLTGEERKMSAETIRDNLAKEAKGFRVECYGQVSSTLSLLRAHAASGEDELLAVTAESQTEGRGRRGRSFYSPGGGIYLSILLRPKFTAEKSLYITTAAAAAVAEAVEKVTGLSPKIKWVNDLYLDGKKICGILTEASVDCESGGLEYALLGIGINVSDPERGYPEEIKDIAGSLFGRGKYPADLRDKLTAEIINRFMFYYVNLEAKTFAGPYTQRMFLIGKEVDVYAGKEVYSAAVLGLDSDLRLILKKQKGERVVLSAGEVSVKQKCLT